MIEGVIEYISNNWTALSVTIIVTAISVYISIRYSKSYITSAKEERRNQARLELLNLLENRIINGKDVNLEKIDNLINAIDRKYSVSLAERVSLNGLMEDIELRIEESRHLDPDQKDKFTQEIRKISENLSVDDEDVPSVKSEYRELIENIKNLVEEESRESALEELDHLDSKVRNEGVPRSTGEFEPFEPDVVIRGFAVMVVSLITLIVTTSMLFNLFGVSFIDTFFGGPTAFILVAAFLTLYYFIISTKHTMEMADN